MGQEPQPHPLRPPGAPRRGGAPPGARDELERLSSDTGTNYTLASNFKSRYLRGAGELELVRSGLDDTMRGAYQAMRESWHVRDDVDDLRTAAFLVSIGRVADSYRTKGL